MGEKLSKRVCKMRAEWSELGDCECEGPSECLEPLSDVEKQDMVKKLLAKIAEIVEADRQQWVN